MKAITNCNLNRRIGAPYTTSDLAGFLVPETEITIAEICDGQSLEGNKTWYKGTDGYYYWSGGFKIVPKPNEPMEINGNLNWPIIQYGIDKIWSKTKGDGVKVAIIDSGITNNHPDINYNRILLTRNFLYTGNDIGLQTDVSDKVGHGTHCAGIVAAQGLKSNGVAPNVSLLIGKITDKLLGIDQELLFKGIEWAYNNDADVISVSITVDKFEQKYQDLIADLDKRKNAILVCSLSDDGDIGIDMKGYPYLLDASLGIGAVNKTPDIDEVTARSKYLDILAPGSDIYSTWNDGGYKNETGCSMATPFVAGIIALMIAYLRNNSKHLTKSEIIQLILKSVSVFLSFKSQPLVKFPVVNPTKIFENL